MKATPLSLGRAAVLAIIAFFVLALSSSSRVGFVAAQQPPLESVSGCKTFNASSTISSAIAVEHFATYFDTDECIVVTVYVYNEETETWNLMCFGNIRSTLGNKTMVPASMCNRVTIPAGESAMFRIEYESCSANCATPCNCTDLEPEYVHERMNPHLDYTDKLCTSNDTCPLPSESPSSAPTAIPSAAPTKSPRPSLVPSSAPTASFLPSSIPTSLPSSPPTTGPTASPSGKPSIVPTSKPSSSPSEEPSDQPSEVPTKSPAPSSVPSSSPSSKPSSNPTSRPSTTPTQLPSELPSKQPSESPSEYPTLFPYNFLLQGQSTIVEDVPRVIGPDITWTVINPNRVDDTVSAVNITGFPAGSVVSYTDTDGTFVTYNLDEVLSIQFGGNNATEAEIRAAVDSITLTAPPESDVDFQLIVTVTDSTDNVNLVDSYVHPVNVQAVADAPTIAAETLTLFEDTTANLEITAGKSSDGFDNSETVSVKLTVPQVDGNVIGWLSVAGGVAPENVTFTDLGNGEYLVEASGSTPTTRLATLNAFLSGGITFTPREHLSGSFLGTDGIKVEAISTEDANGYGTDLAPNDSLVDGTLNDTDTKIEIAVTYIDVTIDPVNDVPTLLNNATIVQENNMNSDVDENLTIPIGTRMYIYGVDDDGSQTIDLTLTGFPTNAQDLSFATVVPGVVATADKLTGTVTISGSAEDVYASLLTLSVTLADDDDTNFVVAINGTLTDSGAGASVTSPIDFTHDVIVQAVADTPTVDAGTYNKPMVNESSGFVEYPVTVALNDVDGTESYQSVVIDYSTPGGGAEPQIQFGTLAEGVVVNNSTTGQLVLTGPTADIEAALATMQVAPGAFNGEDITITVTATAVENSTEINDGGFGQVGSEIAVPTASSSDTFTIPVYPVIDVIPTLSFVDPPCGEEDTAIPLGNFLVTLAGNIDEDGSELVYVEIDLSNNLPEGTTFESGGTQLVQGQLDTTIVDGWLRVPQSLVDSIDIRPPVDFSGNITLSARPVVQDTTASGTALLRMEPTAMPVCVEPMPDPLASIPLDSVGTEDEEINFGAVLAAGMPPQDNGTSTGNNDETETISQVVLDIPKDQIDMTYLLSGPYIPASSGTVAVGGDSTAEVTFDETTRMYTITSTIITGATDEVGLLTQADREQAEADIRAALATFNITIGPENNDVNGVIDVTATTLDVNLGVAVTQDNFFEHEIIIAAVADAPLLNTTNPEGIFYEDNGNIPLFMGASLVDKDGSETLPVRITVPTDEYGVVGTITGDTPNGVTLTYQGNGVYLVEATGGTPEEQEAALNSYLNGDIAFNPRHDWSGTAGVLVEAIATESNPHDLVAVGEETATVSAYIDITVRPVVDHLDPLAIKGNAVGDEDSFIDIPMNIGPMDTDGSETIFTQITGGVPPNASLYHVIEPHLPIHLRTDESYSLIEPDINGVYTLSLDEVNNLAIVPPLHYSSIHQGTINLTTITNVTDQGAGFTDSYTLPLNVTIKVTGVADKPNARTVYVNATEDEPYRIGEFVGSLDGVLVDQDGSESISLKIIGLPKGVYPFTSNCSTCDCGICNLGGGSWRISAEAVPGLELPPDPQYSGEDPYSGIEVTAVSQEKDNDQATSDPWTFVYNVWPVIDGFGSWGPGYSTTEASTENGTSIAFSGLSNFVLIDDDGSEVVMNYTLNLTDLIQDAQIDAQLDAMFPGATLDDLVAEYLYGEYDYNPSDGTVTILPENVDGIFLNASLFLDSNEGFSFPVQALVRESAVIDGEEIVLWKIEKSTFAVDIAGTPDIPTVFCISTSGYANNPIPLTIGGETTDTDVALLRNQSEAIFYVVNLTDDSAGFSFLDQDGNITGNDNGDGSWILSYEEVATGVSVFTLLENGTLNFEVTTVATENDGHFMDQATNTTTCSVLVTPGEVNGTCPPGVTYPEHSCPTLTIPPHVTNEDESVVLDFIATLSPAPELATSLSFLISGLPAGADIDGVTFNPVTGKYFVRREDLDSGLVSVTPPQDFSGTFDITVEAVTARCCCAAATCSSGEIAMPIEVDPVADGPSISIGTSGEGLEDEELLLTMNVSDIDIDGSEVLGPYVYVLLSNGAELTGVSYDVVTSGDEEMQLYGMSGTDLVGYYRIPIGNIGDPLPVLPAENWHGPFTVTVAATTEEPADDNDGDKYAINSAVYTVNVEAVADPALLTVPIDPVVGDEDTYIPIPDLSVTRVDNVEENGMELVSAIIEGVPDDTMFSVGFNNGDGTWAFPVGELPTLEMYPPPDFAGNITMTLVGITLELDNDNEARSSMPFTVEVTPVADEFLILAKDVAIDAVSNSVALDLNVRDMDIRGTDAGEIPQEEITLTFTNVPTGIDMTASLGGDVSCCDGTCTFTGTQSQSNALSMVSNSYYYCVNPTPLTRDEHVAIAQGLCGTLAAPHNAESNAAIYSIREQVLPDISPSWLDKMWVDGDQRGGDPAAEPYGGWVWFDLSPIDYTNWVNGEPNNWGGFDEDCLWMMGGGQWNDAPCSDTAPAAYTIPSSHLGEGGIDENNCVEVNSAALTPVAPEGAHDIQISGITTDGITTGSTVTLATPILDSFQLTIP